MYKIKPYLILDIEEGCVLQNGLSTVVITNIHLINFLKQIEADMKSEVTVETIKEKFSSDYENVIKFLLDNKVMVHYSEPDLIWNNIWLISNDNVFSNYFTYSTEGMLENFNRINIKDYQEQLIDIRENDLCLVFLNPFNLIEYINICNTLVEKGAIIKTGFFYNHSIYISNFHKRDWYNPCPKCFFYSLETQLRGALDNGSINFQTLIDLVYKHNPKFNIQADLKPADFIIPISILIKDLKYNEIRNNFINNVYEIHLDSHRVNEDISYHWEMCDCYE